MRPTRPRRPSPQRFAIVELTPDHRERAAEVLAAAFLDDPAWVAIGPRRRTARHRLLQRYYDILTTEAVESAGPSWCAMSEDDVAGVALVYPDGRRFPPNRATLREAPPFILAGPGPGLRGAWVDHVMKRAHPSHEHLLLWYIGVRPELQRIGAGRALLHQVGQQAARVGRPIYLDTTRAENVSYYENYGYRQIGQASLPRGARVWFMHLDAPSADDMAAGR